MGRAETALPGVVDRHVHLGLVDRGLLADSPVVEVHDLGWTPSVVARWAASPPSGVTISYAGSFHTAPGGYPSGRPWAPDDAVRPVLSVADAGVAVTEVVQYGGSVIKIALHTSMPLLDDDVLGALVSAAHDAGLPAVVHVEGLGQVERAVAAGVDVLAHAPWTERVPDDVLAAGARMTWISTLAIHGPAEQAVAIDNVRRFRAVGGTVVYGTDLGNGPMPVGVNNAEITALGEAGLSGDDLLAAVLAPETAGPHLVADRPRPHDADSLIAWLADARRITSATTLEDR